MGNRREGRDGRMLQVVRDFNYSLLRSLHLDIRLFDVADVEGSVQKKLSCTSFLSICQGR